MKKTLLSLFIAVLSVGSFAQTTISNANMESWTGSGATIEPTQWNSTKSAGGTFGGFAPQTCWQESTNPHGGTYCAKLVTGNALGTNVNGALTSGRIMAPSTNAAEGFIQTVTNDANYSMTFVGRPDSFVFWYRYTPVGSDFPSVEARLHINGCEAPEIPVNNNHPNDTANIVARAQWQGSSTTVGTWTRVSVPFNYRNSTTPQFILITSTSSGSTATAQQNSTFWLDDFDVIYNPTIATGTINPLTYYVSAATGASVSVPYTLTGTFNGANLVTAELSDGSGSFASPVNIGSVTSAVSGTINATIPAGTATGTGYRIRVKSSNPALTATANTSNISVNLVANSVASASTQTIAAGVNGTALTVTETTGSTSRAWKYSTTSGTGYTAFAPVQTGTTYTPNFANAGTYYVVCVTSYPNGLNVTSNEVVINVVSNSIAPTATQSILVGVNGNMLTVTETPSAISREWYYATTSGGTYVSITPMQMGTTYTPNFAGAGTYYVVCKSSFNGGVIATSNEVLINVGNATITTGTVTGSPFLFSPSAPDAAVTVPYTTSGTFNNGNVFTAQLSDASGSFTSPVSIGSVTATSSGNINATIPHTTPAGISYRIRVVSSNPVVLGSDNGVDLMVDQFGNSVLPNVAQTIAHGTNGTVLTVYESQTTTAREWKYTTTSLSNYTSFVPAQTGNTYTPNFAIPGTYYVICVSTNTYNDNINSNEVQIDVTNGSSITTSAVSGSPFYISPNMTAPVNVDFTSDAVFNAGNTFTAQLSDYNGSFTTPTVIGILSGSTIGTISGSIPGNLPGSSAYRIRVVSTDPAIIGSDNGTDLTVIPFANSIAPTDTQFLQQGQNGNAITVTENQTSTRIWKYTQSSGIGYSNFSPSQTGTSLVPHFNIISPYYIICESTNSANDKVTSQEVVVIVTALTGVGETANENIKAYWSGNDFVVDLTAAKLDAPVLELMNIQGQVVLNQPLNVSSINQIHTSLGEGIYLFSISNGAEVFKGKTSKK